MAYREEGFVNELEFWLEIMYEHALLIVSKLPCDETALIEEGNQLARRFEDLREQLRLHQPGLDVGQLVPAIEDATEDLAHFKKRVLKNLITCEFHGPFPLLVDHTLREALYFLDFLSHTYSAQPEIEYQLARDVFWLRIMSEHASFLQHFLDPSQRLLVRKAYLFEEQFLQLYKKALDLKNMAQHADVASFAAAEEFRSDLSAYVDKLRRFKQTMYELLSECRTLAVVPPLFAEHVEEEASYFLSKLH